MGVGMRLPNSLDDQSTAHPEAELCRCHPGDPARLETDSGEQSLLDVIKG